MTENIPPDAMQDPANLLLAQSILALFGRENAVKLARAILDGDAQLPPGAEPAVNTGAIDLSMIPPEEVEKLAGIVGRDALAQVLAEGNAATRELAALGGDQRHWQLAGGIAHKCGSPEHAVWIGKHLMHNAAGMSPGEGEIPSRESIRAQMEARFALKGIERGLAEMEKFRAARQGG